MIQAHLADKARHQPQVVVVHPDHRTVFCLSTSGLGEAAVHFAKVGPMGVFRGVQPGERMNDRPQRLFGGDVIELVNLGGFERQAHHVVVAIAVADRNAALKIGRLACGRLLLPGHPDCFVDVAEKALDGGDDSVGAKKTAPPASWKPCTAFTKKGHA